MSANSSYYAVNIDIAKKRAGTSLGKINVFFAISEFVAPAITGLIISWSGNFDVVFALLTGLADYICCTYLYVAQ